MSRRAKLTLAFSRDAPKKQASGFEWTAPPSDPMQAQSRSSHAPGAKTDQAQAPEQRAQAVHKRGKAVAPPPIPWSTGRKLLKVAVVVVATALSLYLLKRRFF